MCVNNVGQTTTLSCVAHQATVLYMSLGIILLSNLCQQTVWVWGIEQTLSTDLNINAMSTFGARDDKPKYSMS